MKRRTKLVLICIVIAISAAGYWWYGKNNVKDALSGAIVGQARRGNIEVSVLASGTVRPSRLVAVGAQESGRITSLKVKLGQTVRKGDLIAEIDSLNQQNALRTAEASLKSIEAQREEKRATLANADVELKRAKLAFEQRAGSQSAYQTAETTVKTTQAQIEGLEAQIVGAEIAVETAKVNLGYTRVTAPLDGTVLLIEAEEGQTVNAAQTVPTIVVLGQIDKMTVQTEISEADVVRVKPGQDVYFTVLGDLTRRWDAKLQTIDPAPDSLRSDSALTTSSSSASSSSSSSSGSSAIYYYGRFDVPNADGLLKTYMTAQVHIVQGRAENVILVPASAVRKDLKSGKSVVEVVDADRKPSTREVETGLTDKNNVEIRSGLKEGEEIVTSHSSGTFTTSRPRGPMGL